VRSFKRWLDRSLAAQAVLIFLLGVGASALFRRGDHPVFWVVQAALYAAIAITFVAVQRRRTSRAAGTDPHGLVELGRRIRHREVPSEPGERESMGRLVDDQLGLLERRRRWLPYSLGFMGLTAAALLALGVATGSVVFPLVFAAFVIGFCCWAVWMRRRNLDRYHYMREALREEHERVS
jgi:peptidoglycan/LPS O-acetylase OafA/YrhL